ncbi:MAG TPA: Uma2 family endonuclease, partial [Ardenticatenaceae bacterium]|nr:Uma2 family endonuclease [Ardenticatenaceae bacterium]
TSQVVVQDAPPQPLEMSYEEFLSLVGEEMLLAEWVDGEVLLFMPPKEVQQRTAGFLYHLLDLYATLLGLGRVLIAPFEMKLERSAREPDILFVATANLHRLTADRLEGPADLIVEIVSPDSVYRDRQRKFREYAAAGVPEYWIVDPRERKQRADFYALNTEGQYDLFATEDTERVESHVLPGFWPRPALLWEEELDAFSRFVEIIGPDRLASALGWDPA